MAAPAVKGLNSTIYFLHTNKIIPEIRKVLKNYLDVSEHRGEKVEKINCEFIETNFTIWFHRLIIN